MPSNDYLESHVKEEILSLKKNSNNIFKEKGVQSEKASKKFSCFVCMDTRKIWAPAWRRNEFSTSIFSSPKYDILNCNGCSDGKDINTSDTTTGYEKNNCSDINGRINELVNYYHSHIKPEEERIKEEEKRKN